MVGIGYCHKVVVYNHSGGDAGNPSVWYGTELHNVRIEITKAANIAATGLEDANTCTVKVHDADLPEGYCIPSEWNAAEDKVGKYTFTEDAYIVITDDADIGAKYTAQTGRISDTDAGLIEDISAEYSYVFKINSVDHYALIPHWELGCR